MEKSLEKPKLIFALVLLVVVSIAGVFVFVNSSEDEFEHPEKETVSDEAITFPRNTEEAFWRSERVEAFFNEERSRGTIFEMYKLYTKDGVEIPIISDEASVSEQNPRGMTFSIDGEKDFYPVNVFPSMEEGLYIFRVDTNEGKTYKAQIDWRAPVNLETDMIGMPEEGYAYFEINDLDISELETNIIHIIPGGMTEEFFHDEIIQDGVLRLQPEHITNGEHMYLFKKEGRWYKVELSYPEDFGSQN